MNQKRRKIEKGGARPLFPSFSEEHSNPPKNGISSSQHIAADVVVNIAKYLLFKDMISCSKVCRSWYGFNRRAIFKRNAKERWNYEPGEFGMGTGVSLCTRCPLWKQKIFIREQIQLKIQEQFNAKLKIATIARFVVTKCVGQVKRYSR